MFFIISDIFMLIFLMLVVVGAFFMFDEIILNGYFATKLRQRFDVNSLKKD